MGMYLHSCNNCQVIDEAIAAKTQNFDILTEENIALHQALIKSRDTIAELQAEVADLNDVLAEERQYNFQLCVEQHYEKQTLLVNANTKDGRSRRNVSYSKKVSFKHKPPPEVNTVPLSKYNGFLSLHNRQQEMYQDIVDVLLDINKNHVKKSNEQLKETRDHALLILDLYDHYRKLFFAQKQECADDHKNFLAAADVLTQVNNQQILEMEQNVIEATTARVNEQTKGAINALSIEIEKRDELVNMLRQQQSKLDALNQELEKQLEYQEADANHVYESLKKQLKAEKLKYSNLEQRRLFDFEGFQTDIKLFKKELAKIKTDSAKSNLEHEIDNLQARLDECYL